MVKVTAKRQYEYDQQGDGLPDAKLEFMVDTTDDGSGPVPVVITAGDESIWLNKESAVHIARAILFEAGETFQDWEADGFGQTTKLLEALK